MGRAAPGPTKEMRWAQPIRCAALCDLPCVPSLGCAMPYLNMPPAALPLGSSSDDDDRRVVRLPIFLPRRNTHACSRLCRSGRAGGRAGGGGGGGGQGFDRPPMTTRGVCALGAAHCVAASSLAHLAAAVRTAHSRDGWNETISFHTRRMRAHHMRQMQTRKHTHMPSPLHAQHAGIAPVLCSTVLVLRICLAFRIFPCILGRGAPENRVRRVEALCDLQQSQPRQCLRHSRACWCGRAGFRRTTPSITCDSKMREKANNKFASETRIEVPGHSSSYSRTR